MKIFYGYENPSGLKWAFIGSIVGIVVELYVRPLFEQSPQAVEVASLVTTVFFMAMVTWGLVSILQGKNGLQHKIIFNNGDLDFMRERRGSYGSTHHQKEAIQSIARIVIPPVAVDSKDVPLLYYQLKSGEVKSFELKDWDQDHIDYFVSYMNMHANALPVSRESNLTGLFIKKGN